jgi:phosphoglucomutase
VLLWLNVLAATHGSVADMLSPHWARFGRNFYSRHDYEEIDAGAAAELIDTLRDQLSSLPGRSLGGFRLQDADHFSYDDTIDGPLATKQRVRILFEGGARLVYRLSGTGTAGATLRIYLERFEPAPAKHHQDPQPALAPLIRISRD